MRFVQGAAYKGSQALLPLVLAAAFTSGFASVAVTSMGLPFGLLATGFATGFASIGATLAAAAAAVRGVGSPCPPPASLPENIQ